MNEIVGGNIMAFVTKKNSIFNYDSPIAMYHDNKLPSKKIMGLLDYQSELIEKYMKEFNTKNVALELPTGSGKTLIGLTIGEYRRRKNREKILFLCPTNQLVHQVVDYANNRYGLQAIAFCGRQSEYNQNDYTKYQRADAIGVTTYSSLFVERTCFANPDIIIMDDVHSSESYIIDTWSVEIEYDDTLYKELVKFFGEYINESICEKMMQKPQGGTDNCWCDMIPNSAFLDKIEMLKIIIDENIESCKSKNGNNKYSWRRIRENLFECNIYIEVGKILIRPWIAPTLTHHPFANAKQRILMSATLGQSGELERITGLQKIVKLPVINDWDKNGVGRRFFVISGVTPEKLDDAKILNELHKLKKKSVVLVPSDKELRNVQEIVENANPGIQIFLPSDIEENKQRFIQAEDAMVLMANRFDGVDFPDDEARMLFIVDLPKVSNLQEKFLAIRMGSNILYSERIKTRIVQAVGRCTRNTADYSVVCVLGNTITKDLIDPQYTKNFLPELRAELELGINTSQSYLDIEEIKEDIKHFFKSDEYWQEADEAIQSYKENYVLESEGQEKVLVKLGETATQEVKFQYAMWKHNYIEAFSIVNQIISILNMQALNGYRSYWNYVGGTLAYRIYLDNHPEFKAISIKMFQEVLKDNISIKWISELESRLYNIKIEESRPSLLEDIIIQFEHRLSQYSTLARLERKLNEIIEKLEWSGENQGLKFEEGHQLLGDMLGYISKNENYTGAPDPYWIFGDSICIVSEDKMYEKNQEIPFGDIRQAASHETILRENEPLVTTNMKVITVMLSNAIEADKSAAALMENIYYLPKDAFMRWAYDAINVIRKLYNTFQHEGDIEWRKGAISELQNARITPNDFIDLACSKPLKSIITN